ncbi:MAG: helix-turn-helix domain-containing protein [Nanoarchaeota archaeon]
MYEDILKKAGLTAGETKTYNALLELGSSSLNGIQEKTGLERRYIYDILNKLIEKGLVSYITEKGKKTFRLTHPNKLLSYIGEQKNKLSDIENQINDVLSDIIKKYNTPKIEISAEVYRGKEGIKAIGEELLTHKNNYFIGGNGAVQKYLPYYWKHYNKRRIKNKVMWHDLAIEGTLMEDFGDLKKAKNKLKQMEYYKYRILPKELDSPHIITIFGDKVALTLWSENPFTFVVKNKLIAESYLKYFKFLWKMAKV